MVLLADGLYPNNTVFNACQRCGYRFIFTLKDSKLKRVWEEVYFLCRRGKDEHYKKSKWWNEHYQKSKWREDHSYRYINDIPYKTNTLHLIELNITWEHQLSTEKVTHTPEKMRFVHITDIPINNINYVAVSEHGRLRWAIENEGFNVQKNQGYGLSHKYSRVSHVATCNYYQCLQIAHMIDQLAYLTAHVRKTYLMDNKETMEALGEFGLATMMTMKVGKTKILRLLASNKQFRY